MCTRYYRIGDMGAVRSRRSRGCRRAGLRGVFCRNAEEAAGAAAAGADFLVMREAPSGQRIGGAVRRGGRPRLCRAGITLAEAWALGASGISELPIRRSRALRFSIEEPLDHFVRMPTRHAGA